MKNILKISLLILSLIFGLNKSATATHMIGGELTYELTDPVNWIYKIQLTLYRDCYNGVPPLDNPVYIGIYDGDSANLLNGPYGLAISLPPTDTLGNSTGMGCLQAPPGTCVEKAIYEASIPLVPRSGGYDLLYLRCCRNTTLTNIAFPTGTGLSLTAHIPDTAIAKHNSSPNFVNTVPSVICSSDSWVFDHSAVDADGDSLVYCFANPYDIADGVPIVVGGSSQSPSSWPNIPNVVFNGGYSYLEPMGTSDTVYIGTTTGLIIGDISQVGQFLMAIKVKEYRQGVLISEVVRDFQYNVAFCDSGHSASFTADTTGCFTNPVVFTSNDTFNIYDNYWDFGDGNVDTGNMVQHTYAQSGYFDVRMISYHVDCSDTAYMDSLYISPCLLGLSNENHSLNVHPNPTHNNLNVNILSLSHRKAKIYDILGKIVLTADLKEGKNEIKLPQLKPGIYFLQIPGYACHKIIKY